MDERDDAERIECEWWGHAAVIVLVCVILLNAAFKVAEMLCRW